MTKAVHIGQPLFTDSGLLGGLEVDNLVVSCCCCFHYSFRHGRVGVY